MLLFNTSQINLHIEIRFNNSMIQYISFTQILEYIYVAVISDHKYCYKILINPGTEYY